jgi:Domain of Unknown Function with PDB structure (DUF3857)
MPWMRRTGSVSLRAVVSLWAVLGVLYQTPAHGGDWLPVTAEELQMTREPKAPGAAAIYLYRQVDRDDTGPEVSYYTRIKILTEEGRRYGDVELPFVKGVESIRGIEARTVRPDGSVVKFDGTVYEKPIANSRGAKLLAKTFTMPEVQAGSIIEYRYRHHEAYGYVFDSHWILSQELFTRYAKFSLVPYPYYALQWSWPRGLPDGSTNPVKDHGRIRLETHDVPAFVTEQLMPPENELKYRVDFIYLVDESPQSDPVKFWKLYGRKTFSHLEKFVDERKAMERALAQIVQATDSPEVKLHKIYARVVRMRNVSFERKKSEEETKRENWKAAHDVEDVWNRGAGDAFELTYLFLALTRAAGFHADLALVSTRDQYFFDRHMMNPRQLNSNLVIVTVDGKDLYLDPGVPFTPFGLLPWYESGVQALRLDDKGGSWMTIPLPPASASRIERKAQLKLDRGGTLAGKVSIRFTGLEAAWRRVNERNEDDTDRNQLLEEQIRNSVPSGIKVTLTNTPDWSSFEEPLLVEYDLEIPGWAAAAGQRQLLKVGLFGNEDDRTFEHGIRTQPMYFDFPYERADDIAIDMPADTKVGSLPKSQKIADPKMSYGLSAEVRDHSVHLSRDISVGLLLVEAKYYSVVRDFFQSVRTGDEEQLVLVPVGTVAQR